jgi:hypothetical protein
MNRLTKIVLLVMVVLTLQACERGCRACSEESCDECVARCVEEQGVSPEICRGAACSSICQPR